MRTTHDIRHPIRDQIKAVSETSKRYYNWFRIFVRTSEYGLIVVIALVGTLVIIPIITFANISHTNTVKFTPTIVNIDPMDDTGWQNVGNIQNIDLSNVAQLSEFNGTNSTSLNAPITPPVLPPGEPTEPQPPASPGLRVSRAASP